MSSGSRENNRLWPLALIFSLLLVICLAVVGVQWKFHPQPAPPQLSGTSAPARISTLAAEREPAGAGEEVFRLPGGFEGSGHGGREYG